MCGACRALRSRKKYGGGAAPPALDDVQRRSSSLIGGKIVKELNYEQILQNVAVVFQKTFLTRESVLGNRIRMGSDASLAEVRAAAKEAQIDDFIMSLPDGYDTKVARLWFPVFGRRKAAHRDRARHLKKRADSDLG